MASAELTDIESVRQFLQKSISDKLQDEDLEVLVVQASAAIGRYCNRELGPTGTATRSFEFLQTRENRSLELVDLAPYEYRTVHSVKLDPDLTEVTLAAVQYRSWPYPARDGTFFGLRLAGLPEPPVAVGLAAGPELPYQTRRVDVNADWGMASVPDEVTHWANETVKAWAEQGLGRPPTGESYAEGPVPRGEDLPLAVKWGLKRWVRPTPSV